MAPLAGVMVFLAVAMAILGAALGWHRLKSMGFTVFVFTALGSYIVLRLLPIGLFPWAAWILAIGIAVRTRHLVAANSVRFQAVVRRTTLAMAILVVVAGASLYGWKRVAEWKAVSSLADSGSDLPNVLLIILDTVRARNLSLYGYHRATSPRLSDLAESGVVFERAMVPSSWTLPAHGSMFTGQRSSEIDVDWDTPLNDKFPTLAEVLREHGYATAGFVANSFYAGPTSGLSRGFLHYDANKMSLALVARNSWAAKTIINKIRTRLGFHQRLARKTAADVNREVLRWLRPASARPFFVFLNYFDAHDPYLVPHPFNTRFTVGHRANWLKASPRKFAGWPREYTAAELSGLVDAYDGAIAYLDEQIGRLFDELEQYGILQQTIVILTSDHGEQFGEQHPALILHGNSLYMTSLHVPLVVWHPSYVAAGQRVNSPVTLQDLSATVVDLLGLTADSPFPGSSWAKYWDTTDSPAPPTSLLLAEVNHLALSPPWEPATAGPMKALLKDCLHYILNGDGREELYNLETDPWERLDLSVSEDGRREIARLRRSLADILEPGVDQGSTSAVGHLGQEAPELDPKTEATELCRGAAWK
jgi:arylsulfatase A-like enzyme